MTVTDQRLWRLPAHAELEWSHWDNEFVVHHLLSNDTHRISELAGALIDHLGHFGPSSTTTLAEHFQIAEEDAEEILDALAHLDFVTCQV